MVQKWSSGGLGRPAVASLQQEDVKNQEGAQHPRVCIDSAHHSAHIPLQGESKKGFQCFEL